MVQKLEVVQVISSHYWSHVLWQYMKSGNPYNKKTVLTHISVLVAQIKKLKKADWHFFGHFSLVQTFPTINHPACTHAPTHLACTSHSTAH